jgi:hypothetical protein
LAVAIMLAGHAFVATAQTNPGSAPPAVLLDAADMEQLVAPIALYPDPLLAQVLPASTYPLEIQSAANWLQANPSPSEQAIDAQALEPSIKALLHYPAVLQMMNAQIDWTQQLGIAFVNQQADVMSAIQRLRVRAQNAGSLVSGPQQQVTTGDDGIEILPADDNVLYVPQYDPDSLYDGDIGNDSYITFGTGYPCGIWLDNGFDWGHHWLGVGGGWNHGWHRPGRGNPPVLRPWQRNGGQPIPVARPSGARFVRPGYEQPSPAARAPEVFNGYQRSAEVQRDESRAQESRPAPPPQARPAPQPVFHAEGNGRAVAAQSERGHASMAPRGGGGGGRR